VVFDFCEVIPTLYVEGDVAGVVVLVADSVPNVMSDVPNVTHGRG